MDTKKQDGINLAITYTGLGIKGMPYMAISFMTNEDFGFYVPVRDKDGKEYYLTYIPFDRKDIDIYLFYNTGYNDGTPQVINRNMDTDLYNRTGIHGNY